MRNIWNVLRELKWFTILALAAIAVGLVLAILSGSLLVIIAAIAVGAISLSLLAMTE